MRRKIRRIPLVEQKQTLRNTFIILNLIHGVGVISMCFVSVAYLSSTNTNSLESFDIVTLLLAVVILALLVIVVGWSSAVINASFAWIFFHLFMIILLLIEIIVCLFISRLTIFTETAEEMWKRSDDKDKLDFENDLVCCGLKNTTDNPVFPCPADAKSGCFEKLEDVQKTVSRVGPVALFGCFMIGLFIFFAGCSLCCHPDVLTLADHERDSMSQSSDSPNPFTVSQS